MTDGGALTSVLGVISTNVISTTLLIASPEVAVKAVKNAPFIIAVRSLKTSSSLVMPLVTLTVYTTLTLLSIILRCLEITVPVTEVADTPSASDMLAFTAA